MDRNRSTDSELSGPFTELLTVKLSPLEITDVVVSLAASPGEVGPTWAVRYEVREEVQDVDYLACLSLSEDLCGVRVSGTHAHNGHWSVE